MANTSLVPSKYRLHMADQFIESISETANSVYYVYVGNHLTSNTSNVAPLYDRERDLSVDAYKNMIYGKRVSSSDVVPVIRNIPYTSNTIYAKYDDSNTSILEEDFYCIVNASSYYHVYKCLDNNNGRASTVQPNFADIVGANTYLYQTSDGYRWKYMYSVSSAQERKFATDQFFPVFANTAVANQATRGAIDIITIDSAGEFYNNYLNGTFQATDIKIDGSSVLYRIANSNIAMTNGYYTGCILYLSSGTGLGQYKTIQNYYTTNTGNYVILESGFDTLPTNGTQYQINPRIFITGNGKETVNAVARALVNSAASNSIYRIEVLERGANYDYATGYVVANSVVGVTNQAAVRPIISPYGGHGVDPAAELGAIRACMSVTFEGDEGNTIPFKNEYKQIGVIKDPIFSNVYFSYTNSYGSFISGEQVNKIKPIRVAINGSMNTTSNVVISLGSDFENQFEVDDNIYIVSSNGSLHQLANVSSVINATALRLTTNGFFTATDLSLYKTTVKGTGEIADIIDGSSFIVDNVTGQFTTGDKIVGRSSGAMGIIDTISRSGVEKSFNTFVQMYKYVGIVNSGTFQANEKVTQNNAAYQITGYLHSTYLDGSNVEMYISNVSEPFLVGLTNTISGNTSLAIMTPNTYYTPELVVGSGEIMYIKNIEPVTRTELQRETFKILFEF